MPADRAAQLKVKRGQVWRDWDSRLRNQATPRLIEILAVTVTHAMVRRLDTGRNTRVRLDRFRESSTGYKLHKVPAVPGKPR